MNPLFFMKKGINIARRYGLQTTILKAKPYIRRLMAFHTKAFRMNLQRMLVNSEAERKAQSSFVFPCDIKFSIIVPLYNTPETFLREMINSVISQTYANWELCLTDGSDSAHEFVGKICSVYARDDNRIRYEKLEKNLGIAGNTNACLEMATGDFIALLDHDDMLHPSALFEVMKTICEKNADFIYTDEETFEKDPLKPSVIHYKPDFAIDNLRANNYICHFSVFSRQIIDQIKGFRSEYDGSQDHDFMLRAAEVAKCIIHIPKILYFWRGHIGSVATDVSVKQYCIDSGIRAVQDHVARSSMKVTAESSKAYPTVYRLKYELLSEPLVSIIIINKNQISNLRKCVNSIKEISTYKNYEIIIVDSGSNDEDLLNYYKELERVPNIRITQWDGPFNCSAINNYGVTFARGEQLLFLSGDTKIKTPDWIQEMLMYAQRSDVGAVGAKMYLGNGRIQHAGLIVGLNGVAASPYYGKPGGIIGYMGRTHYAQESSAVASACMMIPRKVWDEAGGFDKSYSNAYHDVDFCLRIRELGYLVVWTPYAELYHYETLSSGYNRVKKGQAEQFKADEKRLRIKWTDVLERCDPYYNPNFSKVNGFDYL